MGPRARGQVRPCLHLDRKGHVRHDARRRRRGGALRPGRAAGDGLVGRWGWDAEHGRVPRGGGVGQRTIYAAALYSVRQGRPSPGPPRAAPGADCDGTDQRGPHPRRALFYGKGVGGGHCSKASASALPRLDPRHFLRLSRITRGRGQTARGRRARGAADGRGGHRRRPSRRLARRRSRFSVGGVYTAAGGVCAAADTAAGAVRLR
mmetsp:Transcript_13184/g.46718  ORF Transcript_13184/g.46718 Transcript_13184/m.46718 type:complete len:206 (+) Transcript_13184:532-1149(+)